MKTHTTTNTITIQASLQLSNMIRFIMCNTGLRMGPSDAVFTNRSNQTIIVVHTLTVIETKQVDHDAFDGEYKLIELFDLSIGERWREADFITLTDK